MRLPPRRASTRAVLRCLLVLVPASVVVCAGACEEDDEPAVLAEGDVCGTSIDGECGPNLTCVRLVGSEITREACRVDVDEYGECVCATGGAEDASSSASGGSSGDCGAYGACAVGRDVGPDVAEACGPQPTGCKCERCVEGDIIQNDICTCYEVD